MPPNERTIQGRIRSFSLVIAATALVIGLGSVVAERSNADGAAQREMAISISPPHGSAARAQSLSARVAYAHDHTSCNDQRCPGCGVTVREANPAPADFGSASRTRSAAPGQPLPRSPASDDPRAFLANMTAVMHRRGLPLPGDAGRLQSLIDHPAHATSGK